ncbi:MAG: 4Fe-4S dicluster domain-containing protein, partial [Oscillospiraceae bacterium]
PVQCIHYALERPAMSSVLMGARSVAELKDCLKYETASAEDKDYTAIASGTRSAMKGKCMYCNHCLPCPASIDIASVTKYLDIAAQYDTVPATIREHYASLSAHGSDCVSCHNCEAKCPFMVSVCANMEKATRVFGY